MTTTLALVGFGITILIAAFVAIYRLGGSGAKRKEAKEDANEATKQVERRTGSVQSDRGYYERLRRVSERFARLRNRASK